MPLLYSIGKLTVGNGMLLAWRPTVEGLENIPATGGAIFAGNHLSVADELFLGASVPRHLAFWAKSDYFTGTGVKGWISRFVLTGLGAIPVERAGGRAALAAFDAAIPVLQAGDLVAVYPEGTRSPDGRLYRGRTGVARLALAAGVPVIPVGVTGTEKVQPIGHRLPKPGVRGVVVRFGKPLDFTGRPDDRSSLRAITDEVMNEIQRLTGQEYVPRYAPSRSEPSSGAGPASGSDPAGPAAGSDPAGPAAGSDPAGPAAGA
ncbi:lysophospholipid acyltransferase family protein [Plantactinospora siamensis]|uniref:Lysophospholipid acyltransferase family protein n=1 Tax=Plantactinospora siamensis TaxID=555372 RepID=A0ABV6P573_9ACTN